MYSKNLLLIIKVFSKYSLFGLIIGCWSLNVLLAEDVASQVNKSLARTKVSLEFENKKLSEIFKMIEAETGYTFAYDNQQNITDKQVSLKVKKESLEQTLRYISLQANVKFLLVGNVFTVAPSEAKLTELSETLVKRDIEISGVVTSAVDGAALPGVNVIVKGTLVGTITDIDGKYRISVPAGNNILVYSFIGYASEEVAINGRTSIDISLAEDVQTLGEVVVIGYGTARKIDLTGAVTRVNIEEKAMQPNVNLVQSMRGSVAGVNITDNGRAGADGSIVIRGFSSISGSNSPLIVLDGIPYSGGLSDINTNDIESIDILKDGSSAAIYGSRASNGVIMITTKKGKSDKPILNYNAYAGFSDFAHIPKVLGPEKYLQLKKDASAFTGRDLTQLNPLEEINFQAGKTIDPWEEIKQDAPMQSHELSVSGKTNRINYYLSGSYVDQKSPLLGDQFSRISGRLNLDVDITDWLKVGTNTGYSVKDYSGIEAEFGYANLLSPYSEFYFEDGSPRRLPMNDGLGINPVFNSLRNDNKDISNNLFSNIYAEVKLPLPGLTYRVRNGNTLLQRETFNFTPSYDKEGINIMASGSKYHNKTFNLILENIVKYDKTIAENHNIDITLLYGFETYNNNSSRLASNNIFNNGLSFNGLSIGENQSILTNAIESKAVSSMARAGYRFMDKYMINFTVRRDGYSAFGEGKKYGTFPSMGASWVLSNENFMSGLKAVNLLKLRYSYGKNGNRGVDPYTSLSNLALVQYVFGDGGTTSIGLNPTSFANPLLGWETTISSNLGLDFGFFNNRISGAIEVYNTNTSDLLLNRTVPSVNGYSLFFTNIGKMNNKGIEISLNTINIEKKDFQWTSNIIYTLNRNEVVELAGKEDDIASSRFIGEPLYSHYDYVLDGIWQEGEDMSIDPSAKPGYLKFKDIDGNGVITPADRKVIGTSQPDFTWGITNGFSYKGFMLSILFNGRVGGISPNPVLNPGTNFYDRVNVLDLPYWTPENPLTDRPSVGYPNPLGYGFYQKRDYMRLQDLTVSYAFNPDFIKRINLNSLRVYVSGKNLKTWTNWDGYDPEHGSAGVYVPANGMLSGPLIRSWVMGINVQL